MVKKQFDLQRGCNSPHLKEEDIISGLKMIAENIFSPSDRDSLISESIQLFESSALDNDKKVNDLNESLEKLKKQQEKLLDGYLSDCISEDLYKKKNAILVEEIRTLEAKKAEIGDTEAEVRQKKEYIESVKDEISKIGQNEGCVHKLINIIERITVFQTYMLVNLGAIGEIKLNVERLSYKRTRVTIADEQHNN